MLEMKVRNIILEMKVRKDSCTWKLVVNVRNDSYNGQLEMKQLNESYKLKLEMTVSIES